MGVRKVRKLLLGLPHTPDGAVPATLHQCDLPVIEG